MYIPLLPILRNKVSYWKCHITFVSTANLTTLATLFSGFQRFSPGGKRNYSYKSSGTKSRSKPIRMDTLAFLGDLAPAFAVRGCQVKVLSEPTDFFNELCTRSRNSKVRICMAALYLGTGENSKSLVEAVRHRDALTLRYRSKILG